MAKKILGKRLTRLKRSKWPVVIFAWVVMSLMQAQALMAQNWPAPAEQGLHRVSVDEVLAGEDVAKLRQLAVMAGLAEDWPLALKAGRKARKLSGIDGVVFIEISAWAHLGEMAQAQALLREVMELPPSQWTGWQQLGKILNLFPEPLDALALLDQLEAGLNDEASRPIRLEQRAHLLMRLNEHDEAYRVMEAAVDLEPTAERVAQLIRWSIHLEQTDAVMPWINGLSPSEHAHPEFALAYFELMQSVGDVDQAVRILEDAEPTPQVLFYLIQAAQQTNQPTVVEEAWSKMPSSSESASSKDAYYVAHSAQLLGHLGQAWTWFERVDQSPWSYEATLARGYLLLEFARTQGWSSVEESLIALREALATLRSGHASTDHIEQAWALEVLLLKSAGLNDEAIALLSHGLIELPNDEFLLYLRALTAMGMARFSLAEQDFRRLIQLDGDNADALNGLGYMLADQNDRLREAHQLITKAYMLDPQSAAIIDSMGWVNYRLGRLDVALEYLQQAYERQPDPEILGHLIEVLNAQGKTDQVEALLATKHLDPVTLNKPDSNHP